MKKMLIALLLVQLLGCAAVAPQPPGATLDAAQRAEAFDTVRQRVREQYVDPQLRGVDWDASAARLRPQALAAATDEQFWELLDRLTAELGDAHTQVLSPRRHAWWKAKQSLTLGLRVSEIAGELVVTGVAPGSDAERQGLKPGDAVQRIAGQPALDWWHATLADARKSSTPRAQLRSAARRLNAGDASSTEPTLVLDLEAGGQRRQHMLTRALLPDRPVMSSQLLPSGHGYLRLSAFDPDLAKRTPLGVALFDLRQAPGLVIDLRQNSGGSMAMATTLLTELFPRKVAVGKLLTRDGKPLTRLFGLFNVTGPELMTHGNATPYGGAVVVLVDEGSASASELVAAALQGLGRAQVVGRTSCGCLLGVQGLIELPGGGALSFSQMDFALQGSPRIEGRGVVPDVAVPLDRTALQAGRDPDLEAAVALLGRLAARGPVAATPLSAPTPAAAPMQPR